MLFLYYFASVIFTIICLQSNNTYFYFSIFTERTFGRFEPPNPPGYTGLTFCAGYFSRTNFLISIIQRHQLKFMFAMGTPFFKTGVLCANSF